MVGLKKGAGAAVLLAAAAVKGQNTTNGTAQQPWNHEDYTSSPPVYPSPNATGNGWQDAFLQAAAFVDQLTMEEKVQMVTGTPGPCIGNIAPIPRLGFRGLCLQDGPLSLRTTDYTSVFQAGITVGAAWDKDLALQRGQYLGEEFKAKGAHIYLGPVAGPLGRSGYGGRNWEGFSLDPYLTGELFADTIIGIEDAGVQACAKHFVGNEQETQRNPSGSYLGTESPSGKWIEAVSSNIDDRTMHELYVWPFANAVHAGVSSIMCVYNRVNASYGCQNSKLQNGILKDELDFQGYVVSDWLATHAGVAAIEAGLDMNMPGGIEFLNDNTSFFGANVSTAVNNGTLEEDRVNDMIRRIMTPYFRLGQDKEEFPAIDPSSAYNTFFPRENYRYDFTYNNDTPIDVRGEHGKFIRESAAAGIVMLKNVNNTLPLRAPKNIGVYGNDAGDLLNGLYSQSPGVQLDEYGYEFGVLAVGGGSGTGRLSYVVTPLDAIKSRASQDDALVQYVLNNTMLTGNGDIQPTYPVPPEVCLVFLKTWATEGADRTTLEPDWNATALVETVAANCPNTVVITHSGGLNVLPFASNPNVTAILAAHLSGEQAGNSIVDVLYGKVNPSGHLPYTIPLEEDDFLFADITNSTDLINTDDPNAWQSDFKERLLIDYRHFDYYDLPVRYEFGFGLSYTTFEMDNISISASDDGEGAPLSAKPAAQPLQPGGNPALWETVYSITTSVSNTGDVAGHAVAQLYLGLPAPSDDPADITPVKALRGFEKVWLEPGESKEVRFDLMRRDISYWDVSEQEWIIAEGDVKVFAGFSSRDIRAMGRFSPLEG